MYQDLSRIIQDNARARSVILQLTASEITGRYSMSLQEAHELQCRARELEQQRTTDSHPPLDQ